MIKIDYRSIFPKDHIAFLVHNPVKAVGIKSCKDCSNLGREQMDRLVSYVNISVCKKTNKVLTYSRDMVKLLNVAILAEDFPAWCELDTWEE